MDTWEVTFDQRKESEQQGNGHEKSGVNVGKYERMAMAIGGGALVGYALKNRSKSGIALGLMGAGLLYSGATGQCEVYRVLGVNTATESGDDVARDVHVETSITIAASPEDLYSFWRNFENLPRFMEDLESVTQLEGNRSHWVAKGPGGKKVEWDAEIYNEKRGEFIAWRSLPESDITNAGSVHFETAPGGRGTYLKVVLNYNVPGGKAAALFAKLSGREPGQLVESNLKRLKQLIEAGEIPTTEGQTSGREPMPVDSSLPESANQMAGKAAAGGSAFGAGRESR